MQDQESHGARERFQQVWLSCRLSLLRLALARLGNVQEAEDCVQQAALLAFRGLPHFRDEASIETWLHSIVRNVVADRQRQMSRYRTVPWDEWAASDSYRAEVVALADEPLKGIENQEIIALVSRGLEEMENSEFRRVLELRYFDGLSYDQVANRLGSSVGAVRTLAYRARRALVKTPSLSGLLAHRSEN